MQGSSSDKMPAYKSAVALVSSLAHLPCFASLAAVGTSAVCSVLTAAARIYSFQHAVAPLSILLEIATGSQLTFGSAQCICDAVLALLPSADASTAASSQTEPWSPGDRWIDCLVVGLTCMAQALTQSVLTSPAWLRLHIQVRMVTW
jgi:hypothetical protein